MKGEKYAHLYIAYGQFTVQYVLLAIEKAIDSNYLH